MVMQDFAGQLGRSMESPGRAAIGFKGWVGQHAAYWVGALGLLLAVGCSTGPGGTTSSAGTNDGNNVQDGDGGSNGGTPDGNDDGNVSTNGAVDEGDQGRAAVGATLYSDSGCGLCHSETGAGDIGPDIRFVGIEALDTKLRDPASTHPGGVFPDLTDDDLIDLAAFLSSGDADDEPPPSDSEPFHRFDLGDSGVLHGEGYADPLTNCTACHGPELGGAGAAPSCTLCHAALWEGVTGPPPSHTEGKGQGNVLHLTGFEDPANNCTACHGPDLKGAGRRPSCFSCHDQLWPGAGVPSNHRIGLGVPAAMHRSDLFEPETNCVACHGQGLAGTGSGSASVPGCNSCHGPLWSGGGVPSNHTDLLSNGDVQGVHPPGRADPATNCAKCHQADLMGRYLVPACYSCHGQLWDAGQPPPSHAQQKVAGSIRGQHAAGLGDPESNCTTCHQADLMGTSLIPSCWSCHGSRWDGPPDYPPDHVEIKGSPSAVHKPGLTEPNANCAQCHGGDLMGTELIPACYSCHGTVWAGGGPPPTHTQTRSTVDVTGLHDPGLGSPDPNCTSCHQSDLMGRFQVPACYSCHGQLWDAGQPPPSHTDLLSVGSIAGFHASGRNDPEGACVSCHKPDLFGTTLIPSCWSCHGSRWDPPPNSPPTHTVEKTSGSLVFRHDPGLFSPIGNCDACHGVDLLGTPLVPSCYLCHGAEWAGGGPPPSHNVALAKGSVSGRHAAGLTDPGQNCATCHQDDLQGHIEVPACYSCHGQLWDAGQPPPSHTDLLTAGSISGFHASGRDNPDSSCSECHQADLFGTNLIPACWSCHGSIWDAAPDYPPTHTRRKSEKNIVGFHDPGLESPVGNCDQCHGPTFEGTPLIPSCYACHNGPGGDDRRAAARM
ncbi:MAG: hypothetical protein ACE5GE_08695 [Phycisphaerae bacterium]